MYSYPTKIKEFRLNFQRTATALRQHQRTCALPLLRHFVPPPPGRGRSWGCVIIGLWVLIGLTAEKSNKNHYNVSSMKINC